MFTICIITSAVLLIINYIFRRSLLNEVTFLLAFWMLSVITNKYGIIKYYEVSDKTYLVITIGLLCFSVGDWIYLFIFGGKTNLEQNKNAIINWQVLYGCLFLHLISSIYFFVRMLDFLYMDYSFLRIREIYQGYVVGVSFTHNFFERLLLHWVAQPLSILLIVIAIVLVMNNDYSHKAYIILTIIDQLLYYVYTQSRTGVFYIAIVLVVIYHNNKYLISAKNRQRIRNMVFLIIVFITAWTIYRFSNSNKWSGLKTYALYLGGGVSLLNKGIGELDKKLICTRGVNFVHGAYVILSDLVYLLPIRKSDFNEMIFAIHAKKELFVRIGPRVWFNAYYSFFYDFYMDGGLVAVAIESFLFGVLCARSITRLVYNKSDVEMQCKGLLMCIVVFMGVVRWQFVSPVFVFMYIYLFLIFHFKIKITNNRI